MTTSVTWIPESIPDVFGVLADIDGNVIVDAADIAVNTGGGFIDDIASTSATWATDVTASTTWTPEG